MLVHIILREELGAFQVERIFLMSSELIIALWFLGGCSPSKCSANTPRRTAVRLLEMFNEAREARFQNLSDVRD